MHSATEIGTDWLNVNCSTEAAVPLKIKSLVPNTLRPSLNLKSRHSGLFDTWWKRFYYSFKDQTAAFSRFRTLTNNSVNLTHPNFKGSVPITLCFVTVGWNSPCWCDSQNFDELLFKKQEALYIPLLGVQDRFLLVDHQDFSSRFVFNSSSASVFYVRGVSLCLIKRSSANFTFSWNIMLAVKFRYLMMGRSVA